MWFCSGELSNVPSRWWTSIILHHHDRLCDLVWAKSPIRERLFRSCIKSNCRVEVQLCVELSWIRFSPFASYGQDKSRSRLGVNGELNTFFDAICDLIWKFRDSIWTIAKSRKSLTYLYYSGKRLCRCGIICR